MVVCNVAALCRGVFICVALWLGSFSASAGPVLLNYELVSLGDPGRYEYRYQIENSSLTAGVSWFSVDFDPALYDGASLTISGSATGWNAQILQAAFGLPAQLDVFTFADALAVGGDATGFAVQFMWLGGGLPGEQHFTVWDPDTFDVRYEGASVTAAAQGLPEPAALGLSLLALGAAVAAGRRRHTRTA